MNYDGNDDDDDDHDHDDDDYNLALALCFYAPFGSIVHKDTQSNINTKITK